MLENTGNNPVNTQNTSIQVKQCKSPLTHCIIDDSHLQATIRFGLTMEFGRTTLEKLSELCAYGGQLPEHFQVKEKSPFLNFYGDYQILFAALLAPKSSQADDAITHFRIRLENAEDKSFAVEVLAKLFIKLHRYREALDLLHSHFPDAKQFGGSIPPLFDLIQLAQNNSLLEELALEEKDWLYYAISQMPSCKNSRSKPPESGVLMLFGNSQESRRFVHI